MKNAIVIIVLLVIVLFLLGCTQSISNTGSVEDFEQAFGESMSKVNEVPTDKELCSNEVYKTRFISGTVYLENYVLERRVGEVGLEKAIAELSGLDCLEDLSISSGRMEYILGSASPFEDLSRIPDLKNLKALSLSGESISDLSPLRKFTKLESLYIGYNTITNLNIAPLYDLKNLKTLHLLEGVASEASCQELEKTLVNVSVNCQQS